MFYHMWKIASKLFYCDKITQGPPFFFFFFLRLERQSATVFPAIPLRDFILSPRKGKKQNFQLSIRFSAVFYKHCSKWHKNPQLVTAKIKPGKKGLTDVNPWFKLWFRSVGNSDFIYFDLVLYPGAPQKLWLFKHLNLQTHQWLCELCCCFLLHLSSIKILET